jgi:exodeoxyribonuclease-5
MKQNLVESIRDFLSYIPTKDQEHLIFVLNRFTNSSTEHPILIINGYAGTGKTSLISGYVKALLNLKKRVVLMAPTGRAAKVFSAFAGFPASTIHRQIYQIQELSSGRKAWVLKTTRRKNTVFIVDEASMIGNFSGHSGQSGLLKDLLKYAMNNKGNKLILMGDAAQLPPVGEILSQALDFQFFKDFTSFPTARVTLREVVRQEANSTLLDNATHVRDLIEQQSRCWPQLFPDNKKEVIAILSNEFEMYFEDQMDLNPLDELIVITPSNKRANLYNQQIRSRLLWYEEELTEGDQLMVVKNDYYWLKDQFIANGEIIEVRRVRRIYKKFGFTFADLEVLLPDVMQQESLDVKALLDTLYVNGPSMDEKDHSQLFEAVLNSYADEETYELQLQKTYQDPYLNALQVKFAYAITGHKSQGGQWNVVFLEAPIVRNALPEMEDLRWLYTCITRAVKTLYLINFHEGYFK